MSGGAADPVPDRSALVGLLFPDPPRGFPGRRGVKICVRAVHVLCAGVLVGAWLLGAAADVRDGWFAATVATGGVLLLIDLHESAAFLLQVRGLFVIGKLAVVVSLPVLGGATGYTLAAVLLLSVILSHAPSRVRYHVVVGGDKVRGAASKG